MRAWSLRNFFIVDNQGVRIERILHGARDLEPESVGSRSHSAWPRSVCSPIVENPRLPDPDTHGECRNMTNRVDGYSCRSS